MPCDYLFQWKHVIPRRQSFWFTFFIFNTSANGPSFESLILPVQHSTCHETANSHSTPSRQKTETSCRLVQKRIGFLIECGYHGQDDIEAGINDGVDYQEAKNVDVSQKAEGVILGSRRSLNYVSSVAVTAYERYDWTVKHRWHYAAIIDNGPQRLRKESERKSRSITSEEATDSLTYKIITMRQAEVAIHKNQKIDLNTGGRKKCCLGPVKLTSSRGSLRERHPKQVQLTVPPDKPKSTTR